MSRRFILGAFAASVITAAPTFSKAAGFLRGAGNIRSISMISRRTGERFKGVYCIDNEYIPEVLDEISYVMRDWRRNEVKSIDRRTIDIIAASHNLLNTDEPYTLLSGYRSAKTNAMLRRRSRSVARDHCISAGKLLTFDYRLEVLSKFPKPLLSVMVAELVDIIDQILSTWTAVQSEDGVVENTIPF